MHWSFLVVFGFFASFSLQAEYAFENQAWIVSPDISGNDYVRESLKKVEKTAKKDHAGAAGLLRALKDDVEIDGVWTTSGEYLPLLIDCLTLFYEGNSRYTVEENAVRYEKLLSKYAEIAKDKGLWSYKRLLVWLGEIRKGHNDFEEAMEIEWRLALYDPRDYWQVVQTASWAAEHSYAASRWDEFLAEYGRRGGLCLPELSLVSHLLAYGSGKADYHAIIMWLEENPRLGANELKRSLERISFFVTGKDPDFLRDYIKALSNLALRQKVGKERLEVFSLALNEKAKIEMVAGKLL